MTKLDFDINDREKLLTLNDDDFQAALLEEVSRTFALTIPALPDGLHKAVANAYLLCRIVDTIEDEAELAYDKKLLFCNRFIEVVETGKGAKEFAADLAPLLSDKTLPAEHSLVKVTERVIKITHSLDKPQIDALSTCVDIMATGMPTYQEKDLSHGLKTMKDMDLYCFYVAGCVGEMLARLFCHYSKDINKHHEKLMSLAVSFSQGLQMTNILKDIWDDKKRGVCWLPQDVFDKFEFDLKDLTIETSSSENFLKGMDELIIVAGDHLKNALEYTLLIPRSETGIRKFCLLAIFMALLSLKEVKKNCGANTISSVKITRGQVKQIVVLSNLFVRSNLALRMLFSLLK